MCSMGNNESKSGGNNPQQGAGLGRGGNDRRASPSGENSPQQGGVGASRGGNDCRASPSGENSLQQVGVDAYRGGNDRRASPSGENNPHQGDACRGRNDHLDSPSGENNPHQGDAGACTDGNDRRTSPSGENSPQQEGVGASKDGNDLHTSPSGEKSPQQEGASKDGNDHVDSPSGENSPQQEGAGACRHRIMCCMCKGTISAYHTDYKGFTHTSRGAADLSIFLVSKTGEKKYVCHRHHIVLRMQMHIYRKKMLKELGLKDKAVDEVDTFHAKGQMRTYTENYPTFKQDIEISAEDLTVNMLKKFCEMFQLDVQGQDFGAYALEVSRKLYRSKEKEKKCRKVHDEKEATFDAVEYEEYYWAGDEELKKLEEAREELRKTSREYYEASDEYRNALRALISLHPGALDKRLKMKEIDRLFEVYGDCCVIRCLGDCCNGRWMR